MPERDDAASGVGADLETELDQGRIVHVGNLVARQALEPFEHAVEIGLPQLDGDPHDVDQLLLVRLGGLPAESSDSSASSASTSQSRNQIRASWV